MHDIEIFEVGHCKHPEFITLQGGRFKSVVFPATAALIKHRQGNLLFDTGYGAHFFQATRRFPEKLYALTTPVTLRQPLHSHLKTPLDAIFISHFHADHIAGLKDFPHVPLYCSREGYEFAINETISRFTKTRKGVLPALLPEDFAQRAIFIEDLPCVALPQNMYPFTTGYRVFDDVYAIALAGHAKGHYGLLYKHTFFIADAVWHIKTLSENKRPHAITALVADDMQQYQQTIDKLQILHRQSPEIFIIPSHCQQTLAQFRHAHAKKN